jgi:molybdopterin/thiamine biosynthesis adenylyltransferase
MDGPRVIECSHLPEILDPDAVYRLLPVGSDEEYYLERTDRNIGWITAEEQKILKKSIVGIAGCGGMGGQLAEKLVRLGVGEIRIADSEVFDVSNINRQFAATRKNVGHSKAFETARMLREITDDFTLAVYPRGIQPEIVDHFLDGCDVVCDEIEFWAIGARILLHKQARGKGISVFNCNTVGFGTRLFLFTPTSTTMEECLSFTYSEAVRLQELIQHKHASQNEIHLVMENVLRGLVPELPEYRGGADYLAVRKRLFEEGKAAIIATNPPMATGLVGDYILFYLLRNSDVKRNVNSPCEMPGYIYFDAARLESKVVRGKWWQEPALVARQAKDDELDEIFYLRYKIFCQELNFINATDYPNQREMDKYDDRSHHIVVTKENKIVGYTRLILPRIGEKFLIEETVDLPDSLDRLKSVEVSRGLVIQEERRGGTKDLLISEVFDYCQTHGYHFILSFSNKIMLDSWTKRGIKFAYVGQPIKHGGFDSWPLIIEAIKF